MFGSGRRRRTKRVYKRKRPKMSKKNIRELIKFSYDLNNQKVEKKKKRISKYRKATKKNMNNYFNQLDLSSYYQNLENKDELRNLMNYIQEREAQKYNNDLNLLYRESFAANPISQYMMTARKSINRPSNPRIFFVRGHSGACPYSVFRKNRVAIKDTFFNKVFHDNWRILQMQSVGRFNFDEIDDLFTLAMKYVPNFYKAVQQVKTDGDAGNLNKLFLKALMSLDRIYLKKLPIIKNLFGKPQITNFEIYPKPLNPSLQQVPFKRHYYFGENIVSNTLKPANHGVFEMTRFNPKTGQQEFEPFMMSKELQRLFHGQRRRAMLIPGYGIEKIMANLLIPDRETKMLILKFKGRAYLNKLERLNKINKKILEIYKKSKKTNLQEVYINTKDIYSLLFDETYDEESNVLDDIIIVEQGCQSFPIRHKMSTANQFNNNTIDSNLKTHFKKYLPKRSNSRNTDYNFEL